MFSLGSDLVTEIEFKGETLRLDTNFDTVLRYFRLTEDDNFTDVEKMLIAFDMFVENGERVQGFENKVEILTIILQDVLEFKLENDEEEDGGEVGPAPVVKKAYDFEKDAGIIYASFLYDYKIDLFEQQGRLHWLRFLSLFEHLSEESKMTKVIGFRQMKTPSGKDSSAEYRNYVIAMKRKYRLESDQMNEEQIQGQLAGLFGHLKAKARA